MFLTQEGGVKATILKLFPPMRHQCSASGWKFANIRTLVCHESKAFYRYGYCHLLQKKSRNPTQRPKEFHFCGLLAAKCHDSYPENWHWHIFNVLIGVETYSMCIFFTLFSSQVPCPNNKSKKEQGEQNEHVGLCLGRGQEGEKRLSPKRLFSVYWL